MGHSTLETMQKIESAAQAVLDDYNGRVIEIEKSYAEDLVTLEADFDRETEQEVAALKATTQKELSALRLKMEETTAHNEDKMRSILTDRKKEVTRSIIDRVVESYGH